MAVAMSTFGSTLSDLQRLTNEDRGLDYQRANFQDQINAQRLSDFLKARSEENRTKAQRDADAARLLDAQQARSQQGRQFDAELGFRQSSDAERARQFELTQRNLMEIERNRLAGASSAEAARAKSALDLQSLAGTNAVEIAKIQAANRQVDPRYFQTLADTEALNQETAQKFEIAKSLSAGRKKAVGELENLKASYGWLTYDANKEPRVKELQSTIAGIDAQAGSLGIGLTPAPDGGFIIPAFTPMRVPAMLNPGGSSVTPTPTPSRDVSLPYLPENQYASPPLPSITPSTTDDDAFLNNLKRKLGSPQTSNPFIQSPIPSAPPVRRFRVTPDSQFMSVP